MVNFFNQSAAVVKEDGVSVVKSTVYVYDFDGVKLYENNHTQQYDNLYDALQELINVIYPTLVYVGLDVEQGISNYLATFESVTYTIIYRLFSSYSEPLDYPYSSILDLENTLINDFLIGTFESQEDNYYYFDNCKIYYYTSYYSKVVEKDGEYVFEDTNVKFWHFSLSLKKIETTCCILVCCEPDKYILF